MKSFSTLFAAGLAAALGAAAFPAKADSALRLANSGVVIEIRTDHGRDYRRDKWLAPHQVRHILRRNGYRAIAHPDFKPRRNIYLVEASNRRGHDVLLIVSAANGRILGVENLDRGRRGRRG